MAVPSPLSSKHRLMKFMGDVFGVLGVADSYAEVYIVDGKTIRNLNKKFRGKDKATDVLAFPYPDDFPVSDNGPRPLGDIYLNPVYIKKNKETEEYLLLHGLLHLLGFNHDIKSDRIKMEKLEKSILKKTNTPRNIN